MTLLPQFTFFTFHLILLIYLLVSSTISSSSYQSPTTTISQPSNHHHILHPSFILFDLIFKLINKKKYHTHYVHLKKNRLWLLPNSRGQFFLFLTLIPHKSFYYFFLSLFIKENCEKLSPPLKNLASQHLSQYPSIYFRHIVWLFNHHHLHPLFPLYFSVKFILRSETF
jgi:hypothetical protein